MQFNIGDKVEILSIPSSIAEDEYEIGDICEIVALDRDEVFRYSVATMDESDEWAFPEESLGDV